ncbi:MFS transporter [Rhodococcus sp. NPDC059968]|uniref:MFS transporter n=1 Tax=Rhodococcus sp. NPDC059968 TaxID=3347017 RepID=UPI003670D519
MSATSPPPREPTTSARLRRVPVVTRIQRGWLAVLAAMLLFDMADSSSFAYVAPAIRTQWGLSIGDIGTITAAAFLGMFVGSVIGGRLADRFGRKRTMVVATIFYSVCSLLSAASTGIYDLALYRVLTGCGLMATTVVLLTYVSEMFPSAKRGRVQATVSAVSLLGVPAMAWLSRWIVPMGPSAWRAIFILGGMGLLAALVSVKVLPESVRWLESQGRTAEAELVVAKIENEAMNALGERLPAAQAEALPPELSPRDLISAGYLRRTIVLCITLSFAISAFYGFNAWMPTLLVEHGLEPSQSLEYTSILSLAAVPGAILAMLFVDRVDRRTAVLVIYVVIAALMLVFGLADDTTVLLGTGLLITVLLQASTVCVYAYMPEIFPTQLRALGAGLGNGAGRLATFVATFVIAAILTRLGYTAVFVSLAAALLLAGLTIGVLGERTRGRSLEEISAVAEAGKSGAGRPAEEDVTNVT